ncbi:MAG: rod shape-determining protein MreD [Acidobacteria bacterium]|nr:rod shape-determining protein MreD [Acidobacteriota bacterium]
MPATYSARGGIEVYRFRLTAALGIPLSALLLQTFLPRASSRFLIFDLPLLVTIFLSVARRNPVSGIIAGSVIGLLQDAMTHLPLGVYGIAKTVVGYGASSLGMRIDVENPLARLLTVSGFYVVHYLVYFVVARELVGQPVEWDWGRLVLAAVANALAALPLFSFLDRFKQKT